MSRHIIETKGDGELVTDVAGNIGGRADLDEALDLAIARRRIVVYFHGGLVARKNGLATADRLRPRFEDAGAYPFFFVWHSSAIEVIRGNLLEIAREDIFERILRRVLDWSVGKARDSEGGRGPDARPLEGELLDQLGRRRRDEDPALGSEPFADEEFTGTAGLTADEEQLFLVEVENDAQLEADLAGVLRARDLDMVGADGGRGAPTAPPKKSLMDQAVLEEIAEGQTEGGRGAPSMLVLAKKALQILRAVLARYRNGTDSGIYPTVVDEILRALYLGEAAGAVWHAMKKETGDTFAADGVRGGRLFLDALAEKLPDDGSVEITLIGHSTGAVFIENLLGEVARRAAEGDRPLPAKTRFQIVYLAPASTTIHFLEAMDDAAPFVHRFRAFTMTDAAERADWVLGAVYPRSLLYLIAGALERDGDRSAVFPVSGLVRYVGNGTGKVFGSPLGTTARLSDIRGYFGAPDRVVLSPTGAEAKPGLRATARSHGDFDGDERVLESLAWMVEHW